MKNIDIEKIIPVELLLALFFISLYLLTIGGKSGYTVDATTNYFLTQNIFEAGVWFPEKAPMQGYLYSIVFLPFYALGRMFISLVPAGVSPNYLLRIFMSVMNICFTTATVVVVFRSARELGFKIRTRYLVAITYGLATMAWPYGRYDFNKAMAAFSLATAFYFFLSFYNRHRNRDLLGLAFFLTTLILVRVEFSFLFVIAGLLLAWEWHQGKFTIPKVALAGAALVVLGGFGFLYWYNRHYWSTSISGGYPNLFKMNPFPGIYGFLFSSGRSIFLYNPPFLFIPLGIWLGWKKDRRRMFSILAWIVPGFMLYSFWGKWWGGWAWGPRHLLPLFPVAILTVGYVWEWGENKRWLKNVGIILIVIGAAVQFTGIIFDFNDYYLQAHKAGANEQLLNYNWGLNPIYNHLKLAFELPFIRYDFGIIKMAANDLIAPYISVVIGIFMLALTSAILLVVKYRSEEK